MQVVCYDSSAQYPLLHFGAWEIISAHESMSWLDVSFALGNYYEDGFDALYVKLRKWYFPNLQIFVMNLL